MIRTRALSPVLNRCSLVPTFVSQSVLLVPGSIIPFVIIVLDIKEKRVKIMSDAREILTWHI